jgi:cobalt-zinc-cadmium resistance protein CzcA
MFKYFTDYCLKIRYWIFLFLAVMIVAGVYSLLHLPLDALPDITNVQVMVNAKTGALSPEEIETDVTRPIESELFGLPMVEEIRSLSKYGLSQATVIFKDGMDPYFARQLVSERLQNLPEVLPQGIGVSMGPMGTGLGEVMQFAVAAKKGSALDSAPDTERLLRLRTVQDYVVTPRLITVPGIATVDTIGGLQKVVYIGANPLKMLGLGLDMGRLGQMLEGIGVNTGGAFIETGNHRYILRSHGRVSSVERISRYPLRLYALGSPIELRQVADVREGGEPRVGAAVYRGREAVVATVIVRMGENSHAVAEAALKRLREIKLPPDVEIIPLYSQSYLVNATIRTVEENLFMGAVLVIVILLLLLRNVRAAILVALAIPFSMVFATFGMYYTGVSANLMSLGAVDFGLIVNGAVVVVENIVRRLEESPHLTPSQKYSIISEATGEVAAPVTGGILIILIVYAPILSLSGVEGKLFAPMAKTVVYALLASLVIALAVMPGLALMFLGRVRRVKRKGRLQKAYKSFLNFSIRYSYVLIGAVLIVAALAVITYRQLGQNFLPQLDEGDLVLSLTRPADISLPHAIEVQKKVDSIIEKFPEVERVFSKIGAAESNVDPNGLNLSDTFLILKKDKSTWPVGKNGRRRTKAELSDAICSAIRNVSESQTCTPEEPIQGRFNDMLAGTRADVALFIYGPDLGRLVELTDRAKGMLEKIRGVSEVQQNDLLTPRTSTVMEFRIDPRRMNRDELRAFDLNTLFSTAMAGKTIGYYYKNDLRFPIILRLGDRFRGSFNGIEKIPVELPGGGVTTLGALGTIQPVQEVTTIGRDNGIRYASVGVFLKDRDLQSFVREAKTKIKKELKLPDNFRLEWGGQYSYLEKAKIRLAMIIPVSLVLIFIILLRSLGSARHSLLVLLCIPFALTGGVFSLYLRGISFSISAAVGFIALGGIAVLNGIILVDFINKLHASGMGLRESVEQGSLNRIRPVLITALVDGIGFLPMALNTATGAEVQRSLATVVIGGLITATVLTLLVMPCLYVIVENLWEYIRGMLGKKRG